MNSYIILIVQFNKKLDEIPILEHTEKFVNLSKNFKKVIIFDNSQSKSNFLQHDAFIYNYSGRNVGTAGAYDFAIKYAKDKAIDWIILFDQDSTIDWEIIKKLDEYFKKPISKEVGVLLPSVYENEKQISPSKVNTFGQMLDFYSKHDYKFLTAVSSGSIINVNLFFKIFQIRPEKLWLDYVDHWMFLMCQRMGYNLTVINGYMINHKLSINDFKSIPISRVRSIYMAERIYCKNLSMLAFLTWHIKMPIRILVKTFKSPTFLLKLLQSRT